MTSFLLIYVYYCFIFKSVFKISDDLYNEDTDKIFASVLAVTNLIVYPIELLKLPATHRNHVSI